MLLSYRAASEISSHADVNNAMISNLAESVLTNSKSVCDMIHMSTFIDYTNGGTFFCNYGGLPIHNDPMTATLQSPIWTGQGYILGIMVQFREQQRSQRSELVFVRSSGSLSPPVPLLVGFRSGGGSEELASNWMLRLRK